MNVARIEISKNDLISTGYFVDLILIGTLPGCRKSESLTLSFMGNVGCVSITTLFNRRKSYLVKYEEMEKMINILPVIPYITYITITPKLDKFAREDRINMYGKE